jgi:hypothetical protein
MYFILLSVNYLTWYFGLRDDGIAGEAVTLDLILDSRELPVDATVLHLGVRQEHLGCVAIDSIGMGKPHAASSE